MKQKINFLTKTMILLFVMFLSSNVFAFDFNKDAPGDFMKNQGYSSFLPSKNNYSYILPIYSYTPERDPRVKATGGEVFRENKKPLTDDGKTISGTTAKFDVSVSDSTQSEYSGATPYEITPSTEKSVLFKNLYTINGQSVDVKVTVLKLYSTIRDNEVRIYVNETNESDGTLIHRYLGFGIFNKANLQGNSTTDIYDMLKVKIELFADADTNTPYKDNNIILYYNDIDANKTLNEYELAKINVNKSNIFLASSNSLLKINSNNIISSDINNTSNDGWDGEETPKVSLIVKGNSSLQTEGKIELEFGHFIGKDTFNNNMRDAGNGRMGQTDVQFLIPPTITGTKAYSSETEYGAGGTMVSVGNTIKYEITLTPKTTWKEKIATTVTDTLSKGLEYVTNSAKIGKTALEPTVTKNNNGTTTLTWNTSINAKTKLTYDVKVVNGYENNKVSNKAVATIAGIKYNLGTLTNPLPSKEYASDTPNGKDGAKVKKDDVIKYSIKYRNTSNAKEKVKITDTLSKGLKYKKNSAKVGTSALEPKVEENKDGTTTLTWEKEIATNTEENLTYSVDVIGGVSEVRNKAYIQYAKLKSGSTTEYDDYSDKIKLNELVNPLDVDVPDTAAKNSIITIIVGLMFIVSGLIIIKKKNKKALN